MQGPDPVILFLLPIGLLICVITGGLVVYYASKPAKPIITSTIARQFGPQPKQPDDYYAWKENAGRVDEWEKS